MQWLIHIRTAFIWVFYLLLAACTWVIVWLDKKMKFPLGFPRDVKDLEKQQDWCIRELRHAGALPAHAKVQSFQVKQINPHVIFRSNAGIVTINYVLNNQCLTLKCFAKFAPRQGTVWNRTIFNLQVNHLKEAWFNQYFIRGGTIPAPAVYTSHVSLLTGNLCLITEFIENCLEMGEGKFEQLPTPYLQMTVENLATLHALYHNSPAAKLKRVLPIEDGTVYFMDSLVVGKWSKQARQLLIKSWIHCNRRETVIHGDARIGNMMFPAEEGEGRFVFIDWQAVRQGLGVYDLAYFLILSLPAEQRIQVEEQSLRAYYKALVLKGVSDYAFNTLQDDYNHACLCVLVLLSLPLLSGEASAEGDGVKNFARGMNIWRERMREKFEQFDYHWITQHYNLTEAEARNAVGEMLHIIEGRLQTMQNTGFS